MEDQAQGDARAAPHRAEPVPHGDAVGAALPLAGPQAVGEDDYYGFGDETTAPSRPEAELAVNTIAELFKAT